MVEYLTSLRKALGLIFTSYQFYSWGKVTLKLYWVLVFTMQLAEIQELITCCFGAYRPQASQYIASRSVNWRNPIEVTLAVPTKIPSECNFTPRTLGFIIQIHFYLWDMSIVLACSEKRVEICQEWAGKIMCSGRTYITIEMWDPLNHYEKCRAGHGCNSSTHLRLSMWPTK